MHNEIQIFNNPKFGNVRMIEENGNVLFCGNDVASALGYKSPKDAISAHCRGAVKRRLTDALGREQETTFIPEGDIYRLAARSKLPSADEFERWIFDEVLPSLRKHGAYMTPDTLDQMISSPEFGIRLLTELKSEQERRKALEEKIEADAPAVRFANAITSCDTNILVRDLAKILKQNGVDTGEKRLYEQLRSDGYLIKDGSDKNMPTQRSMDLGLFFIKESPRISKEGAVIDRTTKITPKGQKYFLNRYAAAHRRELPARAAGSEN